MASWSGSSPLVVHDNKGLLHNADVVFYHPFNEDRIETTREFVWSNPYAQYAPTVGFLGSGFIGEGGANPATLCAYNPTGVYPSQSGIDSLTVCAWIKSTTATYSETYHWGWLDPSDWISSISLRLSYDAANHRLTVLFHYDESNNVYWNDVYPATGCFDEWTLYAIRVKRTTGNNFVGKISLNGSGWADLGGGAKTIGAWNAHTGCVPAFRAEFSQTNKIADEAVLWKNTALFTSEELDRLYRLGKACGRTMEQYVNEWPFRACFIHMSGEKGAGRGAPLTVLCGKEQDALLWTRGCGGLTHSGILHLYGILGAEDESSPLYESAFDEASLTAPLWMDTALQNLGASLFLSGFATADQSGALSLFGSERASRAAPFTMNIPSFGTALLHIRGAVEYDIPLFMRIGEQQAGGSATLALQATAGGAFVWYKASMSPLYLEQTDDRPRSATDFLLFMKTAPGTITLASSGVWSVFLKGGNCESRCSTLWTNAHPSGSAPYGIAVGNTISCFVNGFGDDNWFGYAPATDARPLFMRCHPGSTLGTQLWMSGVYNPVGSGCFYTFGIRGLHGSGCSLLVGRDPSTMSRENWLFFKVSNTGVVGGDGRLYTHGY